MLAKTFQFLSLLKENNYKEWFQENKNSYEEAKKEFEVAVAEMIQIVRSIDSEIGVTEPKNCIFRIFRDVRFSTDKTPYKTNFGAYIAKGGSKKSEFGGYYMHIEPGRCMLAGGVWMPQPDVLKAIREEIYHNTDPFIKIIESKDFKKHFDKIDSDAVLKTAPKDYPKDWKYIDLLKNKSFTVIKPLTDELVLNQKELLNELKTVYAAMYPFNQYLNGVIDDIR